MCANASLAISCTVLLIIMVVAGLLSMGVGGYVLKWFQGTYESVPFNDSEFQQYDWELSLYATIVVESVIVGCVVFFFLLNVAWDVCWWCLSCCCEHLICVPLMRCVCCMHNHPKDDPYYTQYRRDPYAPEDVYYRPPPAPSRYAQQQQEMDVFV